MNKISKMNKMNKINIMNKINKIKLKKYLNANEIERNKDRDNQKNSSSMQSIADLHNQLDVL